MTCKTVLSSFFEDASDEAMVIAEGHKWLQESLDQNVNKDKMKFCSTDVLNTEYETRERIFTF